MSFTQLTPQLWVSQSELYATNSGIFISDRQACLVDPGIAPNNILAIKAFVEEQNAQPHSIILTHAHWDHILGPEHFPNVPIVTHSQYMDVLQQRGERLRGQIAQWEKSKVTEHGASKTQRQRPFQLPKPTYSFDISAWLILGDLKLHLLHAPGHTADQIAIYHAESGTLWAGDMLSEMEIPMIAGCLRDYRQTLDVLAALDARVLIPGHGTPTPDPAEIQARFDQDRAYLADLHTCVAEAIAQDHLVSAAEVVTACVSVPFAQPAPPNAGPHRWNIESAYAELGGKGNNPMGWQQEWEQ
ncbi:MAG: MBL fold metallo-hydrolase [Anaerolineae bacterium]|nr:MBL fold metallo-hydrolase [Anaerolineae bacterium]